MTFSFQPAFDSGTDDAGMTGATMRFDVSLPGARYLLGPNTAVGDFAYAPANVTLTVTGSSVPANNGTFTITPANGDQFGALPNYQTGGYSAPLVSLDHDSGEVLLPAESFVFGPNSVSVSFFTPYQNPPNTTAGDGDPVLVSHWNGLTFSNNDAFQIGGAFFYGFQGAVVSAVPEPSDYALAGGMMMAGFAAFRRHRRSRG